MVEIADDQFSPDMLPECNAPPGVKVFGSPAQPKKDFFRQDEGRSFGAAL
jgi:hypothetical protein